MTANQGLHYMNYGHNEIVGKVVFGVGCIINPTCSIMCESTDPNAKIIFGDYNIIEEKAIISFKPSANGSKVMKIGSYNLFSIRSYVSNTQVGHCNVFEPKCEIKDCSFGDRNMIGCKVRLTKHAFEHDRRIFYPSKVKVVDIFDQERHKETHKALYELSIAKPTQGA